MLPIPLVLTMDKTEKREFIQKITDEVKVFHPLLEAILPKLAGISSYEYTHGQFERGADFVLERTDAALQRRTYIGVVAKAAKLSADTGDVEEQIRECAEERRYKVLNKVRCPEVWVFCAQGYTERAKEKIEKRLHDRAIQFFGPEDLIQFIDDYHPYFWFDLPHQLGSYLQTLSKRLQMLDESTALATFSGATSVEIDLDTFERQQKGYRDKQRPTAGWKNVNLFEEAKHARISVLEADMGFGKSRLARRLARTMCSADLFRKEHLVPVFSSFKQFVDQHDGDLDKLITTSLGDSIEVLDDPDVSVFCILDGLDEITNDGCSSAHWFQVVVDFAKSKPNVRIFLTTRPTQSLEERVALHHDAKLFGIRPLSLAKIVKYLEQCCSQANLPKRLYEDLKKSPLFQQLPRSPIAAALFSNLLSQNQQEVPQSLTELYSKSVELMLGRWEQKKQLATEQQFQTAELVAEQLAEYFIDNQLVYMSDAEAVEHVRGYFKKRRIGITQDSIVSLLFDRSNIFNRDPELGTISFRHRSLAEFLCAKRKYRERNLSVENVALNPSWTNVMFFYSGLRLDCADLLSTVQKLVPRNEFEEWIKIFAVPTYLLAAYQTEFSVVEDNCHLVLLDAAKLYFRVRRGETKTPLVDLTEMQLLYLFKLLISEGIAYEYFERAFESIMLHIQSAAVDEEIKQYALFFLGCAAVELNNYSVFTYVLEDIGVDKLPLPISLAIRVELESHTNLENSRLLRNHRSRLQRLLALPTNGNKGAEIAARNTIKDIFDKPLSARRKGSAESSTALKGLGGRSDGRLVPR